MPDVSMCYKEYCSVWVSHLPPNFPLLSFPCLYQAMISAGANHLCRELRYGSFAADGCAIKVFNYAGISNADSHVSCIVAGECSISLFKISRALEVVAQVS